MPGPTRDARPSWPLAPRRSCRGQDPSPPQRHIAEASTAPLRLPGDSSGPHAEQKKKTTKKKPSPAKATPERPEGSRASGWARPPVFIYSTERSLPSRETKFLWLARDKHSYRSIPAPPQALRGPRHSSSPGGSCSPRRMPVCVCGWVWVGGCVCVCMCG